MEDFRQYINVGTDSLEFRFAEVINPTWLKYFVQVFDGEQHVVSFEIKKGVYIWEIVPPAPLWIKHLEAELNEIIKKYAQQKSKR